MKNESKVHKPYIQRRLDKIREVIKDFSCLKFIPSKMNSANDNERIITSVVIEFAKWCAIRASVGGTLA